MKNIFTLLVLFSLVSCGEQVVKKLNIAPEAQPYVLQFEEKMGHRIDDLEVHFAHIQNKGMSEDVIGYCQKSLLKVWDITGYKIYKTPEVVLDIGHWNSLDAGGREWLVNHELGHCIFDRGHKGKDQSVSIMAEEMDKANTSTIYADNYVDLTRDLFGDRVASYFLVETGWERYKGASLVASLKANHYETKTTPLADISAIKDCVHHEEDMVLEEHDHLDKIKHSRFAKRVEMFRNYRGAIDSE